MPEKYLSLGVSAAKTDVHAAIKNQDAGEYPGAFCKLMPDFASPDWVSAFHADGAGTKSSLAYVKYRESGDPSVFEGIAQDSVVMNLDDLLCVGATGPFYMSNTIGRNAHLVGADAVAAIISGYEKFTAKMRDYGIDIRMCGGETADVGDLVRTVIVDSTFFTRLPREKVIDNANIQVCDFIVGLASYGKADYEDAYNAGMGSNGLTAARHLLLDKSIAEKYPESYSPTVDEPYTGRFKFGDKLPGTDMTAVDAILSPTRTYAPVILKILEKYGDKIHGIIHNTGGAHTKCLNFCRGMRIFKDALFPAPPLFKALAASDAMTEAELYRVFNMGCRMEIYTDSQTTVGVIETAKSLGVNAQIIGRVERNYDGDTSKLYINSQLTTNIVVYEK